MNLLQPLALAPRAHRVTARDWVDELARLPMFAGLGRRELRKLAGQARFEWFQPGDDVVVFGAHADSLFVILAGSARARGKRATRTLTRGDFFGEMSLIGRRRSATVVATSELNVMLLPQPIARELLQRHPQLGFEILEKLGQRLMNVEQTAA